MDAEESPLWEDLVLCRELVKLAPLAPKAWDRLVGKAQCMQTRLDNLEDELESRDARTRP